MIENILQKIKTILSGEHKVYADAIIRNQRGEYLVIKRSYADDFEAGKWGFVGGKVDKGELPLQAVVREVEEETGLKITSCNQIFKKEIKGGEIHYFQCEIESDLIYLDSNEIYNYKWATKEELLELDLIIGLKDSLEEILGKQSYGCLMVNPDQDFKDKWDLFVQTLLKGVSKEDIVEIENEPHVTVLYGLQPSTNTESLLQTTNSFVNQPLEVILSKLSIFDNKDYDVLKLSVDSEDLIALNSFIKTQFPFVSEYLIYQPHMTIAYLKKGVGSKLVEKYKNDSNKVFLKMSDFTYSDSNKKKYNFNALDSVSKNRFAENLFKGEENDLSLFELDLEKSYKYIKREPDGKGGWKYFYAEDMKPVSQSKEEKGILNTKTGLNIENYSDKAILVSGDTLSQKDLLRKVKDELGVGTFNPKLKGWVFPSKFVDKILGFFWTDALNKNEELADEIQNTKNESLQKGDEVSVNGLEGKISNPVSDENGIKYDIKLNNGVELNGVDEKMLEAKPQTKSKEIEETINSASEETRAKVEKKLYGLKPIENLHSYSLEEVLSMNGISDAEIREALDKLFTKKEDSGEKKTTTRSYSSITKKSKEDGLTKRQLISKLLYAHYQSVKSAIESGQEVPDKAMQYYSDLKEVYSSKRKELSEEHKRKIAEALKKQQIDEAIEQIANSINIDDFISALNSAKAEEVAKLQKELDKQVQLSLDLKEKIKATGNSYNDIEARFDLKKKLSGVEGEILNITNKISCLNNGGDIIEFKDEFGNSYSGANYRDINTENVLFEEDTILTEKRPPYIPEISESKFESNGYTLDSMKISDNLYLVATNRHNEKPTSGSMSENGYVSMTLDQLVLTQDYYLTKKKAQLKEDARRKNERALESWNKMPDTTKERYLMQKNMYHSLPAKEKKSISKEDYENLTWQEREKIYIPVKKYGAKKITYKFNETTMPTSFHTMYERFVDKNAKGYDRFGKEVEIGSNDIRTGNRAVFDYWREISNQLKWKKIDIDIQRENLSEIRAKALETSYGDSNTSDALKDKFGILVKRQNGDDIKPMEVEDIEKAWSNVENTFGKLKQRATDFGLKISHSGEKLMFARKAVGIYIPSMKTIGVSNKYGSDEFGFTLAHETAHFIDNQIGLQSGKSFASSNYDSTAGKLAFEFRKNMNEKSDSNYTNSTQECFARALEQYFAVVNGDTSYYAKPNHLNKEKFDKLIPSIEAFLTENKSFFKSMSNDLGFFDLDSIDIIKGDSSDEEYTVNGTIKPSTRKGKKAMVYMDGSWYHFGDAKMKHNYSKEARESATARHKKNLEGGDSKSKAFRVYWKKYWSEGGSVKTTDTRTKDDMEKSQALDIIKKAFDLGKISEEQYLDALIKSKSRY